MQDKSKVQKTSPKDRKSEQSENGKRMGMGKEEMEKPEQDTWREVVAIILVGLGFS